MSLMLRHFTELIRQGSVISMEGQDFHPVAGAGLLVPAHRLGHTGGYNFGKEISLCSGNSLNIFLLLPFYCWKITCKATATGAACLHILCIS